MAKREPGISRKAPLPAKLTAPKLHNVVQRRRLFKLLDAALRRPVVWVSAPAGAGKTTLVASYLSARNIAPLWYQIDQRDADPATFFAYLRQAVARLSPRKRETLPLLSPEYVLGLPVFVRNFFEQMFARLPVGMVLVFDNFQELPESSPLADLLAQALSVLPEGARIIFISRADAPQTFSLVRATRQMGCVGPEALLLSTDEARQIANCCAPAGLPESRLDELNGRAGGWAAGLILLLEGVESEARITDDVVDEHLFDFFAAEILRRAPPPIQDFLMRSALLPVMDAAATASLTGNRQAEPILRDLVRRNYFITRRTGAVARYEFHPLFRNYLLEELHRRCDPESLRQWQLLAGQILAECGEDDDAVELLIAAGATGELVRLVLGRAGKLIAEGRFLTLEQWLLAIPAELMTQQPWLVYWLGVSRMPFDLPAARGHFEQAYGLFSHLDEADGIFLSWAGIAETVSLMWDDFGGMKPWLDEYSLLRGKYPDFPSEEVGARVQAALFGVLMFMEPQHPESAAARETVETLLLVAPDPDFRLKMAANLSLYYSWAGAFADMRRVLEAGERIIATETVSPLSQILAKTNRGTLYWLTGEPERAHEAIGEALRIAAQSGVHLLDAYALFQSVYASGIQGDSDAMGEKLAKIRTLLSPQRRIDLAHYQLHVGWYKDLCGEYGAAVDHLRSGMKLLDGHSAQMAIVLGRLGLAKALIQTGEYRESHALLDQAIAFTQAMPSRHLEFTGRMIRAYSWLRQRKRRECVGELGTALRIAARESDYWTFPLWDPRMVSPLCAVALQEAIETDYVRTLIRKWRLSPTGNPYELESWPWPVRIHVLGRFTLSIDDQPVATDGRGKTRVIELLKAIVAMGGTDVAEHRISDALWPDADGDLARQNFKTTLHRLRKLIGAESVSLHDGMLALEPRFVWLDLQAFERLLPELEAAQNVDEVVVLANRAIELYRGGFLPQERAPWMLSPQERTRTRFLCIIDQAAERLAGASRWAEALACYRKASEIEPLAERFYEGMMRCHYQLGQAAEGLVAYRRCRETLARELDITPSAKTEEWRERLRRLPG